MDRYEEQDLDALRALWEDTEGEDGDTSDEAFEDYLAEREHYGGDPETAAEVEANETASNYGGF